MHKLSTFLCYLSTATVILAGSINFEGNQSIQSEDLRKLRIPLGQSDGQFVPDASGIPVALDKVMPEFLSEDAVDGILRAVTAYYHSEGFGGAHADVTAAAYREAQAGGDLLIQITERVIVQTAPSIVFEGNISIPAEELLSIRLGLYLKVTYQSQPKSY